MHRVRVTSGEAWKPKERQQQVYGLERKLALEKLSDIGVVGEIGVWRVASSARLSKDSGLGDLVFVLLCVCLTPASRVGQDQS